MALGKAVVNKHGVCIRPIGKHPLRKNSKVMLVVEVGQGKDYKALGHTAQQVAEFALRNTNPNLHKFTEEQKVILRQIAN